MQKAKRRFGHHLIAGGVFLWIALSVAINFSPVRTFAVSGSEIFTLSNQQRVSNGLSPYINNAQLATSAQNKAQHMLSNSYFAHDAPDGTTAWSFIAASGYDYSAAAENLAASNQGASAIVTGWMNSPGHRANLLNTTYQEVGYGVVYVGDWLYEGVTYPNTYFVVAHYGLANSTSSTPENVTNQGNSSIPPQSVSNVPTDENNIPQTSTVENADEKTDEADDNSAEDAADTVTLGPSINRQPESFETVPVASVVREEGLVSPTVGLLLGTLALSAIAAGVILELRWIRHHASVGIHLPHLHV